MVAIHRVSRPRLWISAVIVGMSLASCQTGISEGSLVPLPHLSSVNPGSNLETTSGLVHQGSVWLSSPFSGYAGHFRIDIETTPTLPSRFQIEGAELTRLSQTFRPGFTSYGSSIPAAFHYFQSIQTLALDLPNDTEVSVVSLVPTLDASATALIFRQDPEFVTISDVALVLATLQSQSQTAEVIAQRASELLDAAPNLIDPSTLDPIPTAQCPIYVTLSQTVSIFDVAAVLARIQVGSSDPVAIVNRINELLNTPGVVSLNDLSVVPSATIPCRIPELVQGQLSGTETENPTRPGSFRDDIQLIDVPGEHQLLLNLDSFEFDPILQVIDAATGSVVVANDDNPDSQSVNAQVVFSPDPDTTYLARVTSFGLQEQGRYGLGLQSIQPTVGTITGWIWNDSNGTGQTAAGESGLAEWTVYLDTNTNGQLDPGEPTTLTDAVGRYRFLDLVPGIYTVNQVVQPGWIETFPTATQPSLTQHSDPNLDPWEWKSRHRSHSLLRTQAGIVIDLAAGEVVTQDFGNQRVDSRNLAVDQS